MREYDNYSEMLPRPKNRSLLIGAVKAGIEFIQQESYAQFDADIRWLANLRAGPQLNPDGMANLGHYGDNDEYQMYIRHEGADTSPKLVLLSHDLSSDSEIEKVYWVSTINIGDNRRKIVGLKKITKEETEGDVVKLPLWEARKLSKAMEVKISKVKSARAKGQRSGSFD